MDENSVRFLAESWYDRGIGHKRTHDEVIAYIEGAEDFVRLSFKSTKGESFANYKANLLIPILEDFLFELYSNQQ